MEKYVMRKLIILLVARIHYSASETIPWDVQNLLAQVYFNKTTIATPTNETEFQKIHQQIINIEDEAKIKKQIENNQTVRTETKINEMRFDEMKEKLNNTVRKMFGNVLKNVSNITNQKATNVVKYFNIPVIETGTKKNKNYYNYHGVTMDDAKYHERKHQDISYDDILRNHSKIRENLNNVKADDNIKKMKHANMKMQRIGVEPRNDIVYEDTAPSSEDKFFNYLDDESFIIQIMNNQQMKDILQRRSYLLRQILKPAPLPETLNHFKSILNETEANVEEIIRRRNSTESTTRLVGSISIDQYRSALKDDPLIKRLVAIYKYKKKKRDKVMNRE